MREITPRIAAGPSFADTNINLGRFGVLDMGGMSLWMVRRPYMVFERFYSSLHYNCLVHCLFSAVFLFLVQQTMDGGEMCA